jgi:hypothetical protein
VPVSPDRAWAKLRKAAILVFVVAFLFLAGAAEAAVLLAYR